MQAICLNFCFEWGITETQNVHERIEIESGILRQIFERTSTTTDYSTMLNVLHAGPKQRGIERKQFNFTDGTRGDVYRCVLLAAKADPPSLSFPYEDIMRRVRRVCADWGGLDRLRKLRHLAERFDDTRSYWAFVCADPPYAPHDVLIGKG